MATYNGITELTYSCGHTRISTAGCIFAPLTEHKYTFPCTKCNREARRLT